MENPIKMDDLGVPLFLETPIWIRKGIVFLVVINTQDVDEGTARVLLVLHPGKFTLPHRPSKMMVGKLLSILGRPIFRGQVGFREVAWFGKVCEVFSVNVYVQ